MSKGKQDGKLIHHESPDESGLANDQVLLETLRELIRNGRQRALRAVDMVQVRTCWEIGRHIVEFEQEGETRAAYGKRLLNRLADALTAEFGKGFDERNLRHMRAFYQAFPIWNAVRTELSWTHYRQFLRVQNEAARLWYMNEAAQQNWNQQIFASKYRLVLPSEEELRAEIERQRAALEEAHRLQGEA